MEVCLVGVGVHNALPFHKYWCNIEMKMRSRGVLEPRITMEKPIIKCRVGGRDGGGVEVG